MYFSQFWRLEVWNQSASMAGFWWELSSRLRTANFSYCLHMVEWESSLQSLFIGALIPLMRAPPSWPNYLPKAHLQIPSHWGLGFQHINLGREGERGHKPSVHCRCPIWFQDLLKVQLLLSLSFSLPQKLCLSIFLIHKAQKLTWQNSHTNESWQELDEPSLPKSG